MLFFTTKAILQIFVPVFVFTATKLAIIIFKSFNINKKEINDFNELV